LLKAHLKQLRLPAMVGRLATINCPIWGREC
jgi:hypothetical protein